MRNNLRKLISLPCVNNYERRLVLPRPQIIPIHNRLYTNTGHSQNVEPKTSAALPPVEPFVDSYGRRHDYLRISLTERCNLRCVYCMPADGVTLSSRESLLSRDELSRVCRVFVRGGVCKVRLTGGEPSVRSDLTDIVAALRRDGIDTIAITTNAVAITRRLPELQRAGLTAINISLDTLRHDRYAHITRRAGLQRVLAAIDTAIQLQYTSVKINVVLIKGFNDDEIGDFVELTRDRKVEVRFIEFMPFGGNEWDGTKMVPYRVALRAAARAHPGLEPAPPRNNDTATVWRVPGYAGSVGFIHSMSEPFCSTCNRLRLTADGNLKVCLLGRAEVSLRDALRAGATDDQLDALVRSALANKKPRHAAARARVVGVCVRRYSTLSHFDSDGRARMVDVGDKRVTRRAARATCDLHVSARLVRLLRDARLPKGDAVTVAQLAGALGAKRTADLIPLCHTIALDAVRVHVTLPHGECHTGGVVHIECDVNTRAHTGPEMEALVGCTLAALALYDMCKSVDKHMRITDVQIVHKSGGRSDVTTPAQTVRPHDQTPHNTNDETYAPTNLIHF